MNIQLLFTFLILPLFTFNSAPNNTSSSSAKVICLYQMTSRPDSTSKVTQTELTQLAISDSLTEFRSSSRYKGDSLILKYAHVGFNTPALNEGMNAITNLPKYNFKGIIIKNKNLNQCLYYGTIDKVLYYYKDSEYPINWQISVDTATISGYKCQKAFTKLEGRKYTAWFTRQIPISDGPYKFGGLPGLIVKIYDATNSYKFDLRGIHKPTNDYKIHLPGDVIYYKQTGKYVSKEEYYKSYYDYQENFIDKSLASGLTKFDSEGDVRKSYKEKLKHRNNPLELDYKKP